MPCFVADRRHPYGIRPPRQGRRAGPGGKRPPSLARATACITPTRARLSTFREGREIDDRDGRRGPPVPAPPNQLSGGAIEQYYEGNRRTPAKTLGIRCVRACNLSLFRAYRSAGAFQEERKRRLGRPSSNRTLRLYNFFGHMNLSRACVGGRFLDQERVRMVGGFAWCVASSFVAIVRSIVSSTPPGVFIVSINCLSCLE